MDESQAAMNSMILHSTEQEAGPQTQEVKEGASTNSDTHSDLTWSHQVTHKPIRADDSRPIVVTGFGPILSDDPEGANISATVMQEFYHRNAGEFVYNSNHKRITILTGPDMVPPTSDGPQPPIRTSYDSVKESHFDDWLKSTDARLYVHLGIKANDLSTELNPIHFEVQARNGDGSDYFWVLDDYRSKKFKYCIPDGCPCLKTTFDISDLIERVTKKVGSIKGADTVSFHKSCNAGAFLCEFLYYRSLYYRNCANVIFIHIPEKLLQGVSVEDMVKVLEKIVHCLLDMQSQGEENATADKETREGGRDVNEWASIPKKDANSCAFICQKVSPSCENHHIQRPSSNCAHHQPRAHFTHIGDTSAHGCCSNDCKIPSRLPINSKPLKASDTIPTIVVTGFGPEYDSWPNQSWRVVQKFLTSQTDAIIEHNSVSFRLVTGPPDRQNQPVTTTYEYVTSSDFDGWLKSSNARLYVHLGVEDTGGGQSNVIKFEKCACNGKTGGWTPDLNNCAFPGPCVAEGDDHLRTLFSDVQLNELVSTTLPAKIKEAKINGNFSFQESDDAGTFLCDFLYYRSLYCAAERNKASADASQKSYVIFIHIPRRLKPNNIAGLKPTALVLEQIVHSLLDIITSN